MPEIAGMTIGSWILIIVIAVWIVLAVKVFLFGGFKKGHKKGLSVGSCCDHGDEPSKGCEGCHGCDETKATRANAVMPIIKEGGTEERS